MELQLIEVGIEMEMERLEVQPREGFLQVETDN